MTSKKFPPRPSSLLQPHGLDANDPADDAAPASTPSAPIETKSDREFGKIAFPPLCPFCSKPDKEVRCVTYKTKGPMAYFSCKTEGCQFTVKVARPWREKRRNVNDVNVAARPDMH